MGLLLNSKASMSGVIKQKSEVIRIVKPSGDRPIGKPATVTKGHVQLHHKKVNVFMGLPILVTG